MRLEEELQQLRQENTALRRELQRKDEELQQACKANEDLREGLKQAIEAIKGLREHNQELEGQLTCLQERVKTLQEQQVKDSHNSNLPPSSDRFIRPRKQLKAEEREKAWRPAGSSGTSSPAGENSR